MHVQDNTKLPGEHPSLRTMCHVTYMSPSLGALALPALPRMPTGNA